MWATSAGGGAQICSSISDTFSVASCVTQPCTSRAIVGDWAGGTGGVGQEGRAQQGRAQRISRTS